MKKSILVSIASYLLIVCFGSASLFAQTEAKANKSRINQSIHEFTLPSNATTGPMEIVVSLEYYFSREYFADQPSSLCLNIKVIDYNYNPGLGAFRFKYQNKIYRHDEMQVIDSRGIEEFTNLIISDVAFEIGVSGLGLSSKVNVNTNYETFCRIGAIPKDADLNDYHLNWATALTHAIYYSNENGIINRINACNKLSVDSKKYKEIIVQADQALSAKRWNDAKRLFGEANKVMPTEQYPSNKISQIDEILSTEKELIEEKRLEEERIAKEAEKEGETDSESEQEESSSETPNESVETEVETSSNNESSNSSSSGSTTEYFDYDTYYKYYATPEEKRAHDTQLLYNSAAELGASLEQWQADRERKWAIERAEYEAIKAQQAQDENEYDLQVKKTNTYLFNDLKNYFVLLSTQLPHVLENDAVTWNDVLGTTENDFLFGKDAAFVGKKVNQGGLYTSFPKMIEKNDFDIINLPNYFTTQSLKLIEAPNSQIYYWVKTDFYAHNIDYIFNEKDILVGVQIELQTRGIHIKDYYDDLITNLSNSYLMVDANTFVTKDKIFVLDFDYLTIFDLNYLKPDTYFKFPEIYSSYFDPNNCTNCISHLGIKIIGTRPEGEPASATVAISEILPNSISDKNGLQVGDVIFEINEVSISHPFHLQWFLHAYPKVKKYTIRYQRGNELKTVTFTTN